MLHNFIIGINVAGVYSHMFFTESMEIVKGRGDHTLTHDWLRARFVADIRIFEK
jgi:hypothetical protein